MIKTVIKRNGTTEEFSPSKINGWGEWAAKTLGKHVDWSSVVLHTVSTSPEVVTTTELQNRLIDTCLDKKTWAYNQMAGRLYAPVFTKEIHGNMDYPSVKELQQKLVQEGYMTDSGYTDSEYAKIEKIIDHKRNLQMAHFQQDYILKKYALKDRVSGRIFETPQFVFMRMAMELSNFAEGDQKLIHVQKFYDYFSKGKLNAPTPNYTNLGTPLRGFASCCVLTTNDSAASLAAHDHAAYTMTYMSAGIGSHVNSRSLGDPVRKGAVQHLGKLPLYRGLVGSVKAMTQNSRGGSATTYYMCFDPEVETIMRLKNPMSTEDKKIRGLDYALQTNQLFAKKVAKNENIFTFNSFTAPDLYDAFYSEDEDEFERLYEKYEKNKSFKKNYVNAREIVITAMSEAYATGRAYHHFPAEANRHTPFKEKIYSSNLCVAPETTILTDEGYKVIGNLEGSKINVWNGEKFSEVTVAKTGENQELISVKLTNFVNGRVTDEVTIRATPYHKWYNEHGEELRTFQLQGGMKLESWEDSEGNLCYSYVTHLSESLNDDTYCVNEPIRHKVVFNGVLTGQCVEIDLPTKGYSSTAGLYQTDHDDGEIALCSLAAICVDKIENEEEYADVMYYALLMIDRCIHMSHYELPHVGYTAKSRLNAGVGMIGVAHWMAKNKLKYSSLEGKIALHELAEKHMYYAIEASLKLSKEFGLAPWIDKTKWPDGWMPIDTYNKQVDTLFDPVYKKDWEDLRARVIANGGIRNSVLVAHMPSESSSKASGTTNGLYPVRDLDLKKVDATIVSYWSAPDSDRIGKHYEIAWGIDWKDMIDCYAVIQKFTDQGISADLWADVSGDTKVGTLEMIKQYLYMRKMGMKSRYYLNTKTSNIKKENEDVDLDSQPDEGESEEYCSSCTL